IIYRLYVCDPELRKYLAQYITTNSSEKDKDYSISLMSSAEVKPFVNAIPFYDLSVAAGGFSEPQSIDEIRWVSLTEKISSPDDFFVCKVVGESMNEVIPNGSFCLFKKNPAGSRNGKIVLVQHHSITDPDNGGTYTVKTYYSEKTQKGDAL